MLPDPIAFALETTDHLRFPSNLDLAAHLERSAGCVKRSSTGHLVFYRPDGRRFLATDPTGNPLHECEWQSAANGTTMLTRARVRLDWDRWVGLKPGGLVTRTTLNLATKPGWQRLRSDDLRAMAAQALRVPVEEVRWFYRDEDLSIDATGMAAIRHRRDAFYVLEGGGFEQPCFMSCMGAMHWQQIDFLPVVELFKSLLPGTGSAVFELIRGLYDDQNNSQPVPRPLKYRGIPTYPSEAAFRLFSSFFEPRVTGGGEALSVFMDPSHAHKISWLPVIDPPVRYFDPAQHLCVTVQGGTPQKATLATDSAGAPYVNPVGRRVIPLDRSLRVDQDTLVLRDRTIEKTFKMVIRPASPWSASGVAISPVDWRTVFADGVPVIHPDEAYGAVLLYPEDDREIAELPAQPFVSDYLEDLGEQDREIGTMIAQAERVWIDNGDAVIASCVLFDKPREYQASVRHAAYAQRQAQQLWMQCAAVGRWEWLQQIRFVTKEEAEHPLAVQPPCDLIYHWVPYERFNSLPALTSVPG